MRKLLCGLLAASALFAVPASAQLSSLSNPSTIVVTSLTQLPSINNNTILGNITGGVSTPQALTVLPTATLPAFTGGDVTSSAGSTTLSIGAGTVSLAKQANLAANSIQGNNTGSPATPLALTAAQTKTLLAISSGDVSGLAATATSTLASNLTGTLAAAQLPAFTGDATTSAGSAATTVVSATGNGTDFVVASGNRVKVAGNPAVPSPASTDAYLFHTTANGLGLTGNGSGFDFTLYSSGGSAILTLPHGGTTLTASNAFTAAGSILSSGTAGVGYKAGAGGAVTQLTSRTTGVTLNTACGAITIFSAAGAATYNTFTVTDSAVAATDTLIVNEKSGTNLYIPLVTAIGAGTFNLSFATTGGTATDAPVFQFCVIKGANS